MSRTAAERLAIGRAAMTQTATRVARQHACSPSTVAVCAVEFVESLPGYSAAEHIELLRRPGCGALKAARELCRRLTEQP